jgi:tetratricopeptide (TPR) repeat protein
MRTLSVALAPCRSGIQREPAACGIQEGNDEDTPLAGPIRIYFPKQQSQTVATKNSPSKTKPSADSVAASLKQQTDTFNKAAEAFHQRDFKKAKDLFEQAADGPNREMGFSARNHLRMCEQRLAKREVKLETAEDHYTFAVTLMNRQDFSGALPHLEKAVSGADADHYHYALAVAHGQTGNVEKAAHHLRRALDLQPRNRNLALSDNDFAETARHPQIREILQR